MSNIAAKAISALFAIALGFLATSTMANTDNDAIAERIKPVGSVCVEGEDCGGASAAAPAAGGARSASDLYNTKCAACHATGILDAPKFGTSDWADRAGKGLDTLVNNAINGINAMPPRGTCSDCSDDEMKALVEYLVDSAK